MESFLRYLVTACGYISLNFKFVNSGLSIRILQALVPIMFSLLSKPESRRASMHSSSRSPVGQKNASLLGA